MANTEYVWEKIYVAAKCFCGDGTFNHRLEEATISALSRLDDEDITGVLA